MVSKLTAVPSPALPAKSHFSAPSLPPHQQTHNSGWGMQGCTDLILAYLPQTGCWFPSDPLKFLLCPSSLPQSEGVSLSVEMPPHPSAPCQGCCSLPISSFLSFILFGYVGIFLVLLGVQRLPLLFSRYSVRTKNSSICRYILDVLVRIGEFNILLFSHLDPTPPKNVLSTSSLLAQKDIQTHLTLFISIRRIRHFFMESLLLSVENGFPFSRSVVSDSL